MLADDEDTPLEYLQIRDERSDGKVDYIWVCLLCSEIIFNRLDLDHHGNEHADWFVHTIKHRGINTTDGWFKVDDGVFSSINPRTGLSVLPKTKSHRSPYYLENDPDRERCLKCGDRYPNDDQIFCEHCLGRFSGKELLSSIKPWKDPESLFCSPKLKDIIGKELATGTECEGSQKKKRMKL